MLLSLFSFISLQVFFGPLTTQALVFQGHCHPTGLHRSLSLKLFNCWAVSTALVNYNTGTAHRELDFPTICSSGSNTPETFFIMYLYKYNSLYKIHINKDLKLHLMFEHVRNVVKSEIPNCLQLEFCTPNVSKSIHSRSCCYFLISNVFY